VAIRTRTSESYRLGDSFIEDVLGNGVIALVGGVVFFGKTVGVIFAGCIGEKIVFRFVKG